MSSLNRRDLMNRLGIIGIGTAATALTAGAFAPVAAQEAVPDPPPPGTATEPVAATALPDPPAPPVSAEETARQRIACVKPAVGLIETETERGMKWGTGFFVGSDGLMVTNRHVVEGGQKFICIHKNRDRFTAQVLHIDAQYDIAVLQVAVKEPVPTVALGDSDAAATGLQIAVTGYPRVNTVVWLGMALDSSTCRGSVNGLRYGSDAQSAFGDTALQIDAPVTFGNSGGPVFRVDTGEVIGVLFGGLSDAQNLTFAVPINPVKAVIAKLGKKLIPNVVARDAPTAAVEPGEIRVLNTISTSKELPALFGVGFSAVDRVGADERTLTAVADWRASTGVRMPAVSPMFLQGDDLFFGATDGCLRRFNTTRSEGAEVLLDAGDGTVFPYGPVVNDRIICATSGSLDLGAEMRADDSLGAALGMILFGISSRPKEAIQVNGVGHLYGLNRRSGNIEWQLDTGFVGTPLLYGDRVYYGGIGERGCVDAGDGKVVWQIVQEGGAKMDWYHLGYAGVKGIYGVAVPVEGKRKSEEGKQLRLYGGGKARVERYDADTNKILWRREIGDVKDRLRPLSTALYVDEKRDVIYVIAAQVVAALDRENGTVRWVYDQQKVAEEAMKKRKEKEKDARASVRQISFTANMLVQDNILYIGSSDRKLYAFDGDTGKELWTYNTRGEVGAATFHKGNVLFGSSDGFLHVINAKTGNLTWRVQTGSPVRSQPLVKGGMVYAPTEAGTILTIRMPVA